MALTALSSTGQRLTDVDDSVTGSQQCLLSWCDPWSQMPEFPQKVRDKKVKKGEPPARD